MPTDSENVVTKSITINRNIETTFRLWTEQIHAWWPAGHSLSGDSQTRVVLEAWENGRFYERTGNGQEHDWGIVVACKRPFSLTFTWYLGSSPTLPTQVEVHFTPIDTTLTRIDLTHRGPELIGDLWAKRIDIFHSAWHKILGLFAQFTTTTHI